MSERDKHVCFCGPCSARVAQLEVELKESQWLTKKAVDELAELRYASDIKIGSLGEACKELKADCDESEIELANTRDELELTRKQQAELIRHFERKLEACDAVSARLRALANYWRRAAYGIHNESCDKPECMAQLEAAQPKHSFGMVP